MVTFHFRIDLKELINNGKIVTYLENGQIIKSESSVQKLDGKFKYATLIYVRKFPNFYFYVCNCLFTISNVLVQVFLVVR